MAALDADELSYLDVYRRSRQLHRSGPHFPLPRVHGGVGEVLHSLERKGYVAKEPTHPMPETYQLTETGIAHCGGLSAFDRKD
jgi:DNA-binding PadR family transcriptional regulator